MGNSLCDPGCQGHDGGKPCGLQHQMGKGRKGRHDSGDKKVTYGIQIFIHTGAGAKAASSGCDIAQMFSRSEGSVDGDQRMSGKTAFDFADGLLKIEGMYRHLQCTKHGDAFFVPLFQGTAYHGTEAVTGHTVASDTQKDGSLMRKPVFSQAFQEVIPQKQRGVGTFGVKIAEIFSGDHNRQVLSRYRLAFKVYPAAGRFIHTGGNSFSCFMIRVWENMSEISWN